MLAAATRSAFQASSSFHARTSMIFRNSSKSITQKLWASTAANAFSKPAAATGGIKKVRRPTSKWLTSTPLSEWSTGKLRGRVVGWTLFFAGFFSWAIWYGRSIQIKYTPLFKGIMFTLRQDPQVREWIGSDLSPSNHVDGFVNHIKGNTYHICTNVPQWH